jgi:hypothetical protein
LRVPFAIGLRQSPWKIANWQTPQPIAFAVLMEPMTAALANTCNAVKVSCQEQAPDEF